MNRKFGWKRSLPNQNHKKYMMHGEMKLIPKIEAISFPSLIDLRPLMSPIEDQGELGSCVAHATAGVLQYWELQDLKSKSVAPEIFDNTFDPISRLYIYYNARLLDNDVSQDNGTSPDSAIKAINQYGICKESLWPYDPSMVTQKPSDSSYEQAKSHEIVNGYQIDSTSLTEMKQSLTLAQPFIIGIGVYSSFMSDAVAQTGIVPLPEASEEFLGGHALCVVGYEESTQSFIVRNSWGVNWGLQGYCMIPYAYLTNENLASDFWTLRKEGNS